MSGLLFIIALLVSFFFFLYGIRQIAEFSAREGKPKALLHSLLVCILAVIVAIFGFGELHKHTNPRDMGLLASMYVGTQSWALWSLAVISGLIGRLRNSIIFIVASSGLYTAPLVFSVTHHAYWEEFSAFFEYHSR